MKSMDEVREFARAVGIQSVDKFIDMEDLVRTIQLAEGSDDCFRRDPECAEKQCLWYEECLNA